MSLDSLFDILNSEDALAEKYFVERVPQGNISYEDDYWGIVKDPDGRERNLLLEKDKKIHDCKDELAYINSLPPGRLLDVGCGFGYLLSAVSDKWEKHGVEISEYASSIAKDYGEIFVGDVHESNYEKESFDCIISYHVIEHLDEPEKMVRKMYELLKPGGQLIIATPDFDSACARRYRDRYRLLFPGESHISLFTSNSLRRLVEDTGFRTLKFEYPYFNTEHFTAENLQRFFQEGEESVSPPFYGNIMTFYCVKDKRSAKVEDLYSRIKTFNYLLQYQGTKTYFLIDELKKVNESNGSLAILVDESYKEGAISLKHEINAHFVNIDVTIQHCPNIEGNFDLTLAFSEKHKISTTAENIIVFSDKRNDYKHEIIMDEAITKLSSLIYLMK